MANKHRNEVEITFGDNTYTLRATMNAIAVIEDTLDMAVSEIFLAIPQGKARLHQLRTIFLEGWKASGAKLNQEQFENDLEQVGIGGLVTALTPFLKQVFNGAPTDPEKKEQ